MSRHAGLRDAEDRRELRHVQRLVRKHAEQSEAGVVAEQAQESGRLIHIY
jgi:hypothetical protein